MNSVVCPTLLFIEKNDWKDSTKKEAFKKRLTELIDFIYKTNSKIFWNDKLESLLWSNPNLYPWFDSDSYGISQKISQVIFDLSDSMLCTPCSSVPKLNCDIGFMDIISPTLSLIHYLIIGNTEFSFLVDEENEKDFLFSCECHNSNLKPRVISKFSIGIDVNSEIEKNWDCLDSNETFNELIKLVISKYFNDKKLLYNFDYTPKFIEALKNNSLHKNQIFYAIAKRLTKNQKEANQDQSLNDKPMHGSKGVRTFRVTGECRIHYTYSSSGDIIFTDYSSDGEHDKKLSHTRR